MEFAKVHNIDISHNYSVTPKHSGIYPIYPVLYTFWSEKIWIKSTSTEAYPSTQPLYLRRGFIFNNVMVAPRQSSFMFTHTVYFNSSNLNFQYWTSLYKGGEFFETFLYNHVSIFMTHMGNFGNDRLAIFLFENSFKLLSYWTNLKFHSLPPFDLVKKYFELNPDDKEPIWTVFYFSYMR